MPANNCCELDLSILWWKEPFQYRVFGKFSDPTSDRENYLLEPIYIDIDAARLKPLALDADAYGRALTDMLFNQSNGAIREVYSKARAAAGSRDGLRLRLSIEKNARELHALRWETLRDPTQDVPLLTQSNVWFSRFVSDTSFSLRPATSTGRIGALVVIANPSDIQTKWHMAPLDTDAVFADAKRALSAEPGGREFAVERLDGKATVFNIVSRLREQYSDVLYLVCHGRLIDRDEPRLLLENEAGAGEIVKGELLVEKLAGLSALPRLILLASCQSAGDEDGIAFGALGPRLAQNGVASVIAMQGDISIESADKFAGRLFRELSRDGQIDRAAAAARNDVRERNDWWMPALFTCSRTGC
ncbi:MAG TPA: CHAT domain-containing protein, partial [Burkholderiaceae bacterium]|nr:CHAT domain-containing protein [Burkholderiaceae bacterium]